MAEDGIPVELALRTIGALTLHKELLAAQVQALEAQLDELQKAEKKVKK